MKYFKAKKIFSLFWSKNTAIIFFSLVIALVLLISNYRWSNSSITGNEEERLITNFGLFLNNTLGLNYRQNNEIDNVVCINISNDRELIKVNDNLGIPKGDLDITDRKKLATFLQKANNKHEFILLDVIFDSIHKSKNDSLLNSTFYNTNNIIIPSIFKNDRVIHPFFNVNTGISSYKKSIYTNRFVKYSFFENDSLESIALKINQKLNRKNIEKNGMFYYSDEQICLNSIILNHKIKPLEKYNNEGLQNYYDLGVDILEIMSNQEIENLVKNKIVLIGDFEDRDLHPTIYGKMQGVLINYNAYLSLKEDKHIIPKSLIFLLYFIYFIITLIIVFSLDVKAYKSIKNKLVTYNWIKKSVILINKFKLKNIIVHFLGNYIKIGVLMAFISIVLFIMYKMHIEILRSAGFFGTLMVLRDWRTILKQKKNEK